jgi:hypothetical protein
MMEGLAHREPGRLAAGATALALILAGFAARPGEADGFTAQQFRPAVGPQEYFSVHSARTAPQGRFYLGMWYSFSDKTVNPRVRDLFPAAEAGLLAPLLLPITEALADPAEPLDPLLTPLVCGLKPVLDPTTAPALDPTLVDCTGVRPGDRVTLVDKLHTGYPQVLRERPQMVLRVEGHTDSLGSEAYNQRLSDRRAQAVVRYLLSAGIEPHRLEAIGFGESRPIATNETDAGRQLNRRTQFKIIAGGNGVDAEEPKMEHLGPGDIDYTPSPPPR